MQALLARSTRTPRHPAIQLVSRNAKPEMTIGSIPASLDFIQGTLWQAVSSLVAQRWQMTSEELPLHITQSSSSKMVNSCFKNLTSDMMKVKRHSHGDHRTRITLSPCVTPDTDKIESEDCFGMTVEEIRDSAFTWPFSAAGTWRAAMCSCVPDKFGHCGSAELRP